MVDIVNMICYMVLLTLSFAAISHVLFFLMMIVYKPPPLRCLPFGCAAGGAAGGGGNASSSEPPLSCYTLPANVTTFTVNCSSGSNGAFSSSSSPSSSFSSSSSSSCATCYPYDAHKGQECGEGRLQVRAI